MGPAAQAVKEAPEMIKNTVRPMMTNLLTIAAPYINPAGDAARGNSYGTAQSKENPA